MTSEPAAAQATPTTGEPAAERAPAPAWRRYVVVGVIVAAAAVVAGVLIVVVRPAKADPLAVTTTVTGCDLNVAGAARVSFSVANGDIDEHNYQVQLTIKHGATVLGSTVSLVDHVAPGAKESAQALVPYAGTAAGATCAAAAKVFSGTIGHH